MTGRTPALASPAESGEQKRGMAVGAPVAAKKFQRILGTGDGAVLAAFAGAYMHEHRPRVDVVDCQSERFAETQSTGVDE